MGRKAGSGKRGNEVNQPLGEEWKSRKREECVWPNWLISLPSLRHGGVCPVSTALRSAKVKKKITYFHRRRLAGPSRWNPLNLLCGFFFFLIWTFKLFAHFKSQKRCFGGSRLNLRSAFQRKHDLSWGISGSRMYTYCSMSSMNALN